MWRCFNALRRLAIDPSTARADRRLNALRDWLADIDVVAGSDPEPASLDASFRRYFRVQTAAASYIAMDAPPEQEDCRPFVAVAGYLRQMQLNAPRVIAANVDEGFLLLTDLGRLHYLDELREHPDAAPRLYADAISALGRMQRRGREHQSKLPPYDERLLRFELSLFHDWLCGTHLGLRFSAADETKWQELCDVLVADALAQPRVFVHRDYHSRNLMVTAAGNPGILDFQDAVEGPLTYDLVSLLKDCYLSWTAAMIRDWADDFYRALDESIKRRVGRAQFTRHFDLMGAQRHLKAAGIFARLNHRDGKPGYLADIPRTLGYVVELGEQYDELRFLVALINESVLPGLRRPS